MKQIFTFLLLLFVLFSCNNYNDKTELVDILALPLVCNEGLAFSRLYRHLSLPLKQKCPQTIISSPTKTQATLPDLDDIYATYAVGNGFQDKSTAASMEEALNKNASYTKWFDINQFYITQFMMINQKLD